LGEDVAISILDCPKTPRQALSHLAVIIIGLVCFCELLVIVALDAHDDERDTGAVMGNFRYPNILHISEALLGTDAGEDKKDVCVGVAGRSQRGVVFVSFRVEDLDEVLIVINSSSYLLEAYHSLAADVKGAFSPARHDVVVEDGRGVPEREPPVLA
jgi:hypothetical protein